MNYELAKRLLLASRVVGEAYPLLQQAEDYRKKAKGSNGGCFLMAVVSFLAFIICIYGAASIRNRFFPTPHPQYLDTILLLEVSVVFFGVIGLTGNWVNANVIKPHTERCQALANEAEQRGRELLRANDAVLSTIPAEYLNEEALVYMHRDVACGRAQTLNEAMDRYDEYLHRMRMEATANQILAEQQRQSAMLRDLADETMVTNDLLFLNLVSK